MHPRPAEERRGQERIGEERQRPRQRGQRTTGEDLQRHEGEQQRRNESDTANESGHDAIRADEDQLVELLISVAGTGRYRLIEWPPDKKAIDIGDFHADSSLIKRTLGWQPTTALRDGLRRTVEFYRAHMSHYVPSGSPVAAL